MFGLHLLPDQELDRLIERVLTHERVECIAQRVAELLREQPVQGSGPKPPADKSALSFSTGFKDKRR